MNPDRFFCESVSPICFSAVMSCTAADGVTLAGAAALFTPVNGTVATELDMPGLRLRSSLVTATATGTAAKHSVVVRVPALVLQYLDKQVA